MATKKKQATQVIPLRERGTFEISYKQGNEWILYSTRYNGATVQLDVDELEESGKRVQVKKISDKTAFDLDLSDEEWRQKTKSK